MPNENFSAKILVFVKQRATRDVSKTTRWVTPNVSTDLIDARRWEDSAASSSSFVYSRRENIQPVISVKTRTIQSERIQRKDSLSDHRYLITKTINKRYLSASMIEGTRWRERRSIDNAVHACSTNEGFMLDARAQRRVRMSWSHWMIALLSHLDRLTCSILGLLSFRQMHKDVQMTTCPLTLTIRVDEANKCDGELLWIKQTSLAAFWSTVTSEYSAAEQKKMGSRIDVARTGHLSKWHFLR